MVAKNLPAQNLARVVAQVAALFQPIAAWLKSTTDIPLTAERKRSMEIMRGACKQAAGVVKDILGKIAMSQRTAAHAVARALEDACDSIEVAMSTRDGETRAAHVGDATAHITKALALAQALVSQPQTPLGMEGLDFLGADESGGLGQLLQALGTAGSGILTYAKDKQQSSADAADAAAKVQAAINADAAATSAVALALSSADSAVALPRNTQLADIAAANKSDADAAVASQDEAGAAVPASAASQRIAAAQRAVDAARKGLDAALRSNNAAAKSTAKFTLQAAQQTLARAQSGGAPNTAMTKHGDSGPPAAPKSGGGVVGFLKKKVVGPVNVGEALAAAVVTVGGGLYWRSRRAK